MIKKVVSFYIIIIFSISFLYVPVNAHKSFSDVDINSEYYEAVNFLSDAGFETPDGKFYPDEKISVPSFIAMLLNIKFEKDDVIFLNFFEDVKIGENTLKDAINYVEFADFLALTPLYYSNAVECSFLNNRINYLSVWISTFIAADILPMDSSLYTASQYGFDKYANYKFSGIANEQNCCIFTDYIAAAYMTGISPIGTEPHDIPTRGEVANILYKVFTNSFENQPLPESISSVNIIRDCNEAKGCYSFIARGLTKIPQKYINSFTEDGWLIIASDSVEKYYLNQNKFKNIYGVTNYETNTIHVGGRVFNDLNMEHITIHEFGHYIYKKENIIENTLYEKEIDGIASLTREYARENKNEAFSEAFCYYIKNMNNKQALEKMKNTTPITYEMIQNLLII